VLNRGSYLELRADVGAVGHVRDAEDHAGVVVGVHGADGVEGGELIAGVPHHLERGIVDVDQFADLGGVARGVARCSPNVHLGRAQLFELAELFEDHGARLGRHEVDPGSPVEDG
jgi:hypothetical protein